MPLNDISKKLSLARLGAHKEIIYMNLIGYINSSTILLYSLTKYHQFILGNTSIGEKRLDQTEKKHYSAIFGINAESGDIPIYLTHVPE